MIIFDLAKKIYNIINFHIAKIIIIANYSKLFFYTIINIVIVKNNLQYDKF